MTLLHVLQAACPKVKHSMEKDVWLGEEVQTHPLRSISSAGNLHIDVPFLSFVQQVETKDVI